MSRRIVSLYNCIKLNGILSAVMAARTYNIVLCRREAKRGKKDTREVPRQNTGTFNTCSIKRIVKNSIISSVQYLCGSGDSGESTAINHTRY